MLVLPGHQVSRT